MKLVDGKAFLAEYFGTFALAFAVIVSLSDPNFPVPTPVVAALTLGLFVYTIGNVSGCHINPAVTIAAAIIKQITPIKAAGYIIFQVLGGLTAKLIASIFIVHSMSWLSPQDTLAIAAGETLGTLFFTFGVATVMLGKTPQQFSGIIIGGSLLLGISISAHSAYGLLNPAVAIGTGAYSFAYLLAPVVGAVIGMGISKLFSTKSIKIADM